MSSWSSIRTFSSLPFLSLPSLIPTVVQAMLRVNSQSNSVGSPPITGKEADFKSEFLYACRFTQTMHDDAGGSRAPPIARAQTILGSSCVDALKAGAIVQEAWWSELIHRSITFFAVREQSLHDHDSTDLNLHCHHAYDALRDLILEKFDEKYRRDGLRLLDRLKKELPPVVLGWEERMEAALMNLGVLDEEEAEAL
jgi:hypothetical protein